MELKYIKLKKGMTRDEVNDLIGEWILFEDEQYINNKHKHNWKCNCGEVYMRRWTDVRNGNNCKHRKVEERYKYEVEKDGDYEYIKSFKKGEILPNGKIINKNPYIQVKHKYCGSIYEVQAGSFINIGTRCTKCCIKYENSFAHHIEKELNEPLDKYWDFEKNTLNPYHIYKNLNAKNSKCDNKKVWIKCQNKYYHGSYEISCANFYIGNRCSYCANHKVHPLGSIGTINTKIASMIVCDENKNEVDVFNISPHSNKKFYFKCNKCGKLSDAPKILNNVFCRGYSCEYCSDGISIPEKFMANILNQLDIEFKRELNNTTFKWIEDKKRYDFYLPKYNMIIETHGEQHYKDNTGVFKNKTLKEQQENDKYKKELAFDNNIEKYIEIDCRESELEWLKENIIKSLSQHFYLINIDWNKAWLDSQSSKVVETWELYNSGITSTIEIGKILKLNTTTIRDYLHRGFELGKCDYNPRNKHITYEQEELHIAI